MRARGPMLGWFALIAACGGDAAPPAMVARGDAQVAADVASDGAFDAGFGGDLDASAEDATAEDATADDAAMERDASALERDASADASTSALDAAPLAPDASTATTAAPRPIVFVHGIGGNSGEFAVMIDRLVADGWNRADLVALDFPDPRWGCNADNATLIAQAVDALRMRTGAPRIDLVAHSMGVLSSRHYLKNLGGTQHVATYVTLGGMHHGNQSACLNPLPVCVWQEICPTRPFLTQLNDPPATPGPTRWVSIFSTDDDRVSTASSTLIGAENIQVSGPVHAGPMGILEDAPVYLEVRRVLRYP